MVSFFTFFIFFEPAGGWFSVKNDFLNDDDFASCPEMGTSREIENQIVILCVVPEPTTPRHKQPRARGRRIQIEAGVGL